MTTFNGQTISASVIGLSIATDATKNWFRRIVWLILILAGASLSTVQITRRVQYFLSNPSSISIEIRDDGEVLFPEILLCNANSHNASWLEENGVLDKIILEWERLGNWSELDKSLLTFNRSIIEGSAVKFNALFDYNLRQFGPENISSHITPSYADIAAQLCYKFISPIEDSKVVSGSGGGLSLFALAHKEVDVGLFHRRGETRHGHGYSMYILNHGETHMWHDSITLSSGTYTQISLRKKEFIHLPPPYGICNPDSVAPERNCFIVCSLNRGVEGCKGSLSRTCSGTNCTNCSSKANFELQHFQQVYANATYRRLACSHCKPQCEETKYEVVSTKDYPLKTNLSKEFIKLNQFLPTPQSVEQLVDDVVGVGISFSSTRYEVFIQNKLYDVWALLCDIGGALGLFIGSAIFTIFEIADIFLQEMCKFKCRK